MKRYLLSSFILMCLIMNVIAQKSDTKTNSPKKDIRVNREYDEKGNLIKFDSVYSYSWSGDTTLQNSILPEDFHKLFGDQFGFTPDSSFLGDSFFKNFDPFFSPFNGMQDSMRMKKFGLDRHFHGFELNNDSLALNFNGFDDFFNNFMESTPDSISSKLPGQVLPKNSQPRSMDDFMNMLRKQMEEMEEHHREFFKEHPKQ